jgi:hypothetical protein
VVQVNLIQIRTHQFFTQLMRLSGNPFQPVLVMQSAEDRSANNLTIVDQLGACGDFSWLRKLRQGQEFPVPSWSVVAPEHSAQPTHPGFVARAAGSPPAALSEQFLSLTSAGFMISVGHTVSSVSVSPDGKAAENAITDGAPSHCPPTDREPR